MAGTQAPKGFGILFVFVGIPLIIWNAAGTQNELEALDASSSAPSARIEQCVAKTAGIVSDPSVRRQVCECVVDKVTASGAAEPYGSYDADKLDPVIGECLRGDWD